MNYDPEYKWRHATLDGYPPPDSEIVGVVLCDEEPGFTGIYLRMKSGDLYPCRTVDRSNAEHHDSVCEAWMAREGQNEDLRQVVN